MSHDAKTHNERQERDNMNDDDDDRGGEVMGSAEVEVPMELDARGEDDEGREMRNLVEQSTDLEDLQPSSEDHDRIIGTKSSGIEGGNRHGGTVIKAIDKNVVHRICSGQVVVTLATAVKELVENSIDAGATNIDIRLVEYGSKSIEVTDNGCGVEEVNFEGLGLKHHTSKIQEFEDLTSVATFGFRGEALSSLCAMSNLTVITRSARSGDSRAFRIEYDSKGRIARKTQCARDVGTTVVIKDIFSTLPVRHVEFLKNLKREFHKMVTVLYGYCLISAGVRINCTNQLESGTVSKVVSVPGSVSVREKIVCIFGSKQLESLLEIRNADGNMADQGILEEFGLDSLPAENPFKFQGFVSLPYKGRRTNDRQFFFFNSRPCDPSKLSRVVNEVYHGYSRNQSPFIFLDIRTLQENLDVNVTPDKRQIYLQNEKLLYAAVKSTLLSVLTKAASSFDPGSGKSAEPAYAPITGGIFTLESSQTGRNKGTSKDEELEELCDSDAIQYNPPQQTSQTSSSVEVVNTESGRLRNILKDFSYRSKPTFGKPDIFEGEMKNKSTSSEADSSLSRKVSLNGGGKSILDFFKSKHKRRRVDSDEDFNCIDNDDLKSSQPLSQSSTQSLSEIPEETECDISIVDSVEISDRACCTEPIGRSGVAHDQILKQNEGDEDDGEVIVVYDDEFAEEGSTHEVVISGNEILETFPVKLYGNAKVVDCTIDWADTKRRILEGESVSRLQEPLNEARKFRAAIRMEENSRAEEELKRQLTKDMFSKMEILGQFNAGFIIAKYGPDLFIVDQHATDEKYNFEDLEKNTTLQTQKLICPMELQLPAVSEAIILDQLEVFKKNGFDFRFEKSNDGADKVLLTQIPHSKSYQFGKEDIEELIFLLEDAPEKAFYRPSRVRDMLASRACRKSVMIGTALNGNEMRRIIDHMGVMDQPWNCPHGRPTIRHLLNLNMIYHPDIFSFNH